MWSPLTTTLRKFASTEKVTLAADRRFAAQPEEFFLDGLTKLEQRSHKCVELRGECTEQIYFFIPIPCHFLYNAKNGSGVILNTKNFFFYPYIDFFFKTQKTYRPPPPPPVPLHSSSA
jgi:hypothetical protein